MPPASRVRSALRVARIDGRGCRPGPAAPALVAATVLALAASLAVDAVVVLGATRVFVGTRGYGHFHVSDYGTVTAIGVVVAAAAWPVVIRVSWAPRWLYLRLAVAVTVVSLLPDVWLLVGGAPGEAVATLMVLHLAVAVVTYSVVVRVAPAGRTPARSPAGRTPAAGSRPGAADERRRSTRRWAGGLAALVAVEFALGVATLVAVPLGRPSGWVPAEGRAVYLAHAVLGLPLAVGAAAFVVSVRGSPRLDRLSGWIGGVGVALAAAGGMVAVAHPVRLLGGALMLVGPLVAALGYLAPLFEASADGDP